MRRKRSRLFLFILITALTFVTACTSATSPDKAAPVDQGKSAGSKDEKVELRWFMWTGSPEEKQIWEQLAATVTQKYPNISIKFETDSFTNYWDKLQTQIASGTAPDIISLQSLRAPTFAQYNAFEPLNDYIKKTPEFDASDFEKVAIDALAYDGKQLAIPYDFGPYVLFYNKTLFDKYKVPYPDENTTFEQFQEKAKALSKDGNYGFTFRPNLFDQLVPWIWSNGGEYMNADMTKSMIQEPKPVEAIQMLADMLNKDKVITPITDPGNDNFYREQFYSGKAAMYLDGAWNFVNVRSKAQFDWDITTMPKGKSGSITHVAGSGFGIFTKSKHKEEAWKAISVMLSKEGHQFLAKSGRTFPARKSAVDVFMKASDKPKNLAALNKAGQQARPYQVTTNWQETQLMLVRELENVFFKNASVADVTKKIEPLFNKLLDDHQKNVKKK